jgi:hypothetical protein
MDPLHQHLLMITTMTTTMMMMMMTMLMTGENGEVGGKKIGRGN